MEPTPTRTRRRRTITLILATALVVAPATAFATGGFNDVETSDFFSNAVGWMADNGVTAGCNPPSNTRYCPDDFVTRGQMAVFLERLDTKDVFLRPGDVSTDGGDADTLDGRDATSFLGKNEKAVDADKVDGLDASDLRAGVPIAQAWVDGTTLERSFGFATVTTPFAGGYCLTLDPSLGVTAGDVIVTVTTEWGSSTGADLFAHWDANSTDCDADEVEVITYRFAFDGDSDVSGLSVSDQVSFVVTATPIP